VSSFLSETVANPDPEDSIFADEKMVQTLGLSQEQVHELRAASSCTGFDVKKSPSLSDIYQSTAAVLPTMTSILNESTSESEAKSFFSLSSFVSVSFRSLFPVSLPHHSPRPSLPYFWTGSPLSPCS